MDLEEEYIDGMDRHAPEGFEPFRQFFQGETRKQVLRESIRDAECAPEDIAILPGHFTEDEDGRDVFQPFGWMVFLRKDRKCV